MRWTLSHRADPNARVLADRHYNRQKPGTPQFVPPGRCLVLYAATETGRAFWITSWPFAEFVKHEWAGAWVCSAFRNEGAALSSELIREAVSATRARFGEPPTLGMVTIVDPSKVRRKRDFGRCYRRAGFHPCGFTKGGLVALQLLPDAMPAAATEANFPRTRDIRIETAGTDPQGRMTLPYTVLAAIIEAGRRALSQAEGGAE